MVSSGMKSRLNFTKILPVVLKLNIGRRERHNLASICYSYAPCEMPHKNTLNRDHGKKGSVSSN